MIRIQIRGFMFGFNVIHLNSCGNLGHDGDIDSLSTESINVMTN